MAKTIAGDIGGADFAAFIEAAYRADGDDAEWLRRIVTYAQPGLDRGRGVVGFLFAPGAGGDPTVTMAIGVGALPARPEALAAAFLPALAERGRGTTAGTNAAARPGRRPATRARASARASSQPTVRRARPRGRAARCWRRCRARTSCRAPPPPSGCASPSTWARALRLRRAASHAQTVWRGLLSGRWTLVDHFDAGGRRFVIARGKPSGTVRPPRARLTERERDACARAASGLRQQGDRGRPLRGGVDGGDAAAARGPQAPLHFARTADSRLQVRGGTMEGQRKRSPIARWRTTCLDTRRASAAG